MPVYEYRCEDGHTFEVMQRMSDDPVQSCEVCGLPVQRVFHPVAVHFKGSGFYNTDYGKQRRGSSSSSEDSGGSTSDSKSSESSGSKTDSGKTETTSSSSSSSSSD
jgi:putative FmdB family regulatory protein